MDTFSIGNTLSKGSERRKEEFIAECEHWIDLGLHPNIVTWLHIGLLPEGAGRGRSGGTVDGRYAWALTVLEMLLRHRPWRTGAEAKASPDDNRQPLLMVTTGGIECYDARLRPDENEAVLYVFNQKQNECFHVDYGL